MHVAKTKKQFMYSAAVMNKVVWIQMCAVSKVHESRDFVAVMNSIESIDSVYSITMVYYHTGRQVPTGRY